MTGPQGMGPLRPIIDPASLPSQVEFVGATHTFATPGTTQYLNLNNIRWLPGDFCVCIATNITFGGTITPPSWMSQIYSSSSREILAGFIPTAGTSVAGDQYLLITDSGTYTGFAAAVAVYRNVSRTAPILGTVRDDIGSVGDTSGPITVSALGAAVCLASASTSSSTMNMFATTGGSTDRLSVETAADFARALRIFDKLASGSISFTDASSTITTNATILAALTAGPAGYVPGSETITYVGAGTPVYDASGTDILVNMPAGIAEGDILIAVVNNQGNNSFPLFSPETGWTALYEGGSSGHCRHIFIKRAGASEPSTATFDGLYTNSKKSICVAYRNVGAVVYHQTQGSSDALTPTYNTWAPNTVAVAIGATEFYQPISIITANGYTSRTIINQASNGGLQLADKTIATSGSAPGFPQFYKGVPDGGAGFAIGVSFLLLVPKYAYPDVVMP